MTEPTAAEVKEREHWRVTIRPTVFPNELLPLSECREVVQKSQVRLRGWYYPHIGNQGIVNGESWVESSGAFKGHFEYWRLHQSGQFAHLFAYAEDGEDVTSARLEQARRGLEVVTTVYRFTEILTFASRLASKGVLTPAAEISIQLTGTQGRELFFYEPGRYLSLAYTCLVPSLTFSATVSTEDLMGRPDELALDGAVYVLERFNWHEVARGVLAEDQKRLLERRF